MKVKKTQYLLLELKKPYHSSGTKYKDANEVELLSEMDCIAAYIRGRYVEGPGDNRDTKIVIDSINRYTKAHHFEASKFTVVSDSRKGGFSIIAKRDLQAGELLFSESCIFCVAVDIDRSNHCYHCSAYVDDDYLKCYQCVACGEVYCSEECLATVS